MLQYSDNNLKNIELCNFLLEIGFTNEEIIKIVFDPSFFVTYYDKVDVMVKNGYNYLIEKNYDKEKIKKIILRYPGILTFSSDKKNRVENYFNGLGIYNIEFRNMIYRCPNLYGYTIDRIKKYFDFFKQLGLGDNEIIHILKNASSVFNRSISTLKSMVNDLNMYGIDNKKISIISKNYPLFWSNNFEKIKGVVNSLMELGFNKDDSIRILVRASSIAGYDNDTIKNKFKEIVSLQFSEEEVINMINIFPTIIVSGIDRTRNIVYFFNNIGLHDELCHNPKSFFMQSIESSYARYMFYRDMHIEINKDTYRRLFYGWTWFKKTYGVTRDSLLEMYNYNNMDSNDREVK